MTGRQTVDQPSDEELFQIADEGSETAFAEVVGRHVDAVFNHCLRWMGYDSEADDVTSMTFFEAWRKRRGVRFVDGSALPWLLVVATNVARNQTRGRRRYERMLAQLPRAESAPDLADEAIRHGTRPVLAQRCSVSVGADEAMVDGRRRRTQMIS